MGGTVNGQEHVYNTVAKVLAFFVVSGMALATLLIFPVLAVDWARRLYLRTWGAFVLTVLLVEILSGLKFNPQFYVSFTIFLVFTVVLSIGRICRSGKDIKERPEASF